MPQNNKNLDKDTANNILNNVLDTISVPQPEYTVDSLMEKRRFIKLNMLVLRILATIFLILVVISPLAYKGDPDFSLITSSKNVAIMSHDLYDTYFVMSITGSADYTNIRATKGDGAIIYPDKCDPQTGTVSFPFTGEEINIFIPTTNGECIQAVLSKH